MRVSFISGTHIVVLAPFHCHFLKVTSSSARLERAVAVTSSASCLSRALELSLPTLEGLILPFFLTSPPTKPLQNSCAVEDKCIMRCFFLVLFHFSGLTTINKPRTSVQSTDATEVIFCWLSTKG